MEIIDVIREIYYYQKSHFYKNANNYKIVFLVDRKANKVMIRKAFKVMFGVTPQKVNTQNRHPQSARLMPKSRKNFTKAKKLAFVYLKKEDFEKLRQLFAMETIPEEFQSITSTIESEATEASPREEQFSTVEEVEEIIEIDEVVEEVVEELELKEEKESIKE